MFDLWQITILLSMLGGVFLLNNLVNTFQTKFRSEDLRSNIYVALRYGFKAMNEELRTTEQVEQMYAHAAGYMNLNCRKTLDYFGINLENSDGKHALLTMLTANDSFPRMFYDDTGDESVKEEVK